MNNKKGAEMAIGTIVIIIIALVVLVVVIYGFTVGWGNLFDQVSGYGGGKVNVQTHVRSCEVSCTTQSTYDYCAKKRNVIFDESKKSIPSTCSDLELKRVGLDACDAIDCFETYKKCKDLQPDACLEIDESKHSCEVKWQSSDEIEEIRDENEESGILPVGKVDFEDLTSQVTDLEEKRSNQGKGCTKIVIEK